MGLLLRIISSIKEIILDIKYLLLHKEIILIYQMGKVGSSSISHSLKKRGIYCIHTHRLNTNYPFTTIYQKVYQTIRAKIIKSLIKNKKIKIVTLTRDPIARNVSGFFQNLEDFVGKTEIQRQEFIKLFFEKESNSYTINWFDNEIKETFGIDVYKEEFPKEKGYQIIKRDNIELFITRLEDLNKVQMELGSFLGIENFKLYNTNEANNKWYSELYQMIKKEIKFPNEYLEREYNSKYAKHFYTEEEIDAFRRRWLRF